MFVRSPMTMRFTSPRSTALYQIEQSRPMVTSPKMTAVSAKNGVLTDHGLVPAYFSDQSHFIYAMFDV